MKKNLLLFACASLFFVGTTLGQTKESTGNSTKSSTETSTMGKTAPNASTKSDQKEKGTAEDRAREATEKMASDLNMTAEQKQQAMQTNLKYYKALDEMKHNKTEDSNQASAQAHKDQLNKQRKDEFQTYLSAEQMTKMESKLTHEKGDKSEKQSKKSEKSAE